MNFAIGDQVEKIVGYYYPGIVVSVFYTMEGKERVVVESTLLPGMLHIYSPEQLALCK